MVNFWQSVTETFDVLKSIRAVYAPGSLTTVTETFDVLKLFFLAFFTPYKAICN